MSAGARVARAALDVRDARAALLAEFEADQYEPTAWRAFTAAVELLEGEALDAVGVEDAEEWR